MLVLDASYVEAHLSPAHCTDLMEETLKKLSMGRSEQYLRHVVPLPDGNILGLMPAYDYDGFFGVKVISVFHSNASAGYPSHQGEIILFGKEHGEVLAVIDAMSVTKIRTGAVSAAATRALARPDSRVLAILGCGQQGESHLKALSACMSLTDALFWDPNPSAAERLKKLAETLGLRAGVMAAPARAAEEADIICTVTPSPVPILFGANVRPGTHVNAVGACAPKNREIDSALALAARFYCDQKESILKESGDFLIPLSEGVYSPSHLIGTVGDVFLGNCQGRTGAQEITLFDAVGLAVEDIACAVDLYRHYTP